MNSENMTSMGNTRYDWIASLRGVAALFVFVSHLPINMTYEMRLVIGRIGVTAFFLMSGFLAVLSRRKKSGRQYVFNRLMRIYPIYWLFILLMCLITGKQNASLTRILANLTCFQEFLGHPNIIGASWMFPMQVVFFLLIGIMGVDFYIGSI